MIDSNPYRASVEGELDESMVQSPHLSGGANTSRWPCWIIGAVIGASPPALLGGFALIRFWESLPPGPSCGNGALGPLFLMSVCAPIGGLIGAIVAIGLREMSR